jgi:hypothetical protein
MFCFALFFTFIKKWQIFAEKSIIYTDKTKLFQLFLEASVAK